jgi:hypothetical protein
MKLHLLPASLISISLLISCGRPEPTLQHAQELDAGGQPVPDGTLLEGEPYSSAEACASSIEVVDRVEGASTSTSIKLEKTGTGKGSVVVHATYWRCSPSCCPTDPPLPCSNLRYVKSTGPASYEIDDLGVQGMGSDLWLHGSSAHISAAGPTDVHHLSGRPWVTDKVGASFYSPDVKTWLAVDAEGNPHLVWARLSGHVTELWHADRTASGWTNNKQLLLEEPYSFVASFDQRGELHQAWTETPHSPVTYRSPGGAVKTVAPSTDHAVVKHLTVDWMGKAHLAYIVWPTSASAPRIHYATNRSGSWRIDELSKLPAVQSFLVDRIAVAVDDQGAAHLAMSGATVKGGEGPARALFVGSNRSGTWVFKRVDREATGAVSIAVRHGVAYVSYFGSDTFRIARVCPYISHPGL